MQSWQQSMQDLEAEVKGLWLVDFDSGDGYWCWAFPKPTWVTGTAMKGASAPVCPPTSGPACRPSPRAPRMAASPLKRVEPAATPQDFRAAVLAVVARIPKGRVASYGQVAAMAGFPQRPRQVGMVLSGLPEGTTLPWHRVVNTRGYVPSRGRWWGAFEQIGRLRDEGIEVDDLGNLDLGRFLWMASPKTRNIGLPSTWRTLGRGSPCRKLWSTSTRLRPWVMMGWARWCRCRCAAPPARFVRRLDDVDGHVGEVHGHHQVQAVRVARAHQVGHLLVQDVLAGELLEGIAHDVADAAQLLVPVGVLLAELHRGPARHVGALAHGDHGVVARVGALVQHDLLGEADGSNGTSLMRARSTPAR